MTVAGMRKNVKEEKKRFALSLPDGVQSARTHTHTYSTVNIFGGKEKKNVFLLRYKRAHFPYLCICELSAKCSHNKSRVSERVRTSVFSSLSNMNAAFI